MQVLAYLFHTEFGKIFNPGLLGTSNGRVYASSESFFSDNKLG
jgi:hypothetical protein